MPGEATDWMSLTQASGLKPLTIKDRQLLPIVQGGMGVGVSASGLACAVARMGGMGTISAVDLRRRHSDLMMETQHLDKERDAGERPRREELAEHEVRDRVGQGEEELDRARAPVLGPEPHAQGRHEEEVEPGLPLEEGPQVRLSALVEPAELEGEDGGHEEVDDEEEDVVEEEEDRLAELLLTCR